MPRTPNGGRFSRELLTLRNRKGISQREAADRIGCSLRQYQRWENGESLAGPEYLGRVASLFGVDPMELAGTAKTDVLGRLDSIEDRVRSIGADVAAILVLLQERM